MLKVFGMSSENECARDEHGNLKDASEISFFFSPSDGKPISGPNCDPPSPSPAASKARSRPQRNTNQTKFYEAINQEDLPSDCDNPVDGSHVVASDPTTATNSKSTTRKRKKQGDQGPSSRKKKASSLSQAQGKGISTQLFLKDTAGDSNNQVTSVSQSAISISGSFSSPPCANLSHPSLRHFR